MCKQRVKVACHAALSNMRYRSEKKTQKLFTNSFYNASIAYGAFDYITFTAAHMSAC